MLLPPNSAVDAITAGTATAIGPGTIDIATHHRRLSQTCNGVMAAINTTTGATGTGDHHPGASTEVTSPSLAVRRHHHHRHRRRQWSSRLTANEGNIISAGASNTITSSNGNGSHPHRRHYTVAPLAQSALMRSNPHGTSPNGGGGATDDGVDR